MEYRPTGSPGAYDDLGAIENVLFSDDFPDCMRIRSGTQTIPLKRSHSHDASETIHTHFIPIRNRRIWHSSEYSTGRYRQKKDKENYRIAEPAISTPFTSDPALFTSCRGLSCGCMQAKKAVFPNFFRDH
ncbi:hypothetical protein [Nitrosospira multiformis]|uniref:hypothetical protein n=1 Tax=Nitrosospira multiformis TaxID=1231 RepID=UPI001114301C|nr:hypothetical protein [Nitrosospira multiformis]